MRVDFSILSQGSVAILTPISEAACAWAGENLPDDAMHFAGGIAVEARYVDAIADCIVGDGLTIGNDTGVP